MKYLSLQVEEDGELRRKSVSIEKVHQIECNRDDQKMRGAHMVVEKTNGERIETTHISVVSAGQAHLSHES